MLYSPDLKQKVLNEVKEIKSITTVSKKNNIPTSTIATWLKNSKSESKVDSSKKDLKFENKSLKRKLADAELELMILKDLLKKSYNP